MIVITLRLKYKIHTGASYFSNWNLQNSTMQKSHIRKKKQTKKKQKPQGKAIQADWEKKWSYVSFPLIHITTKLHKLKPF